MKHKVIIINKGNITLCEWYKNCNVLCETCPATNIQETYSKQEAIEFWKEYCENIEEDV